MVAPITIIATTLVLMLICIIFNLKIKIKNFTISLYWLVVLVGSAILLIFGFVDIHEIGNLFVSNTSINPVKIIVIFLSCTALSVILDEIGFFKHMAQVVLQKAKSSQTKLFFSFYAIISLLTIITSNDIIILTFTPFICYFAKHAKIDPTPYIVSEFVAANTWSMFLIIGNPTNIYLATSFNINFFEYLLKMALPTIAASLVSLTILYLVFRKKLSQKLKNTEEEITPLNKPYLTIGLIGLISAIFLMAISSYIGLEMWYISLICALVTYLAIFTTCLIKKDSLLILKHSLAKIPYALIPFLFGMTIIVISLNSLGITQSIANLLSSSNIILIGIFALLLGNLINNIPMSMLMSSVVTLMPTTSQLGVVYSSIIASNICAFFTPIGALAGIMFMKILKDSAVEFSFLKFTMYGIIVCLPTLLSSLACLLIIV